jgi:hypothetical protein
MYGEEGTGGGGGTRPAGRATRFDLPPSRKLIIVSYRHQRAGRARR